MPIDTILWDGVLYIFLYIQALCWLLVELQISTTSGRTTALTSTNSWLFRRAVPRWLPFVLFIGHTSVVLCGCGVCMVRAENFKHWQLCWHSRYSYIVGITLSILAHEYTRWYIFCVTLVIYVLIWRHIEDNKLILIFAESNVPSISWPRQLRHTVHTSQEIPVGMGVQLVDIGVVASPTLPNTDDDASATSLHESIEDSR